MENNHNNANDTQQKDNRCNRPSFGCPSCTPSAETTCGELQAQIRLARIREGLEEALQLAAERATLLNLWQHPSEGETPLEAVEGEIALIDGDVVYQSRRTIAAGLVAFEELYGAKPGFIPGRPCEGDETPPLDGIVEEAITKKEEN